MLSDSNDSYENKSRELISRTIELCGYSHIFSDDNGRIFGFILRNKLLIEDGISLL